MLSLERSTAGTFSVPFRISSWKKYDKRCVVLDLVFFRGKNKKFQPRRHSRILLLRGCFQNFRAPTSILYGVTPPPPPPYPLGYHERQYRARNENRVELIPYVVASTAQGTKSQSFVSSSIQPKEQSQPRLRLKIGLYSYTPSLCLALEYFITLYKMKGMAIRLKLS